MGNALLCSGSAKFVEAVGNFCFGPAGTYCGHAFASEQAAEVVELELAPWEAARFDGMIEVVDLEASSVVAAAEERTWEVAEGIWADSARAWPLRLLRDS